MFPRSLIVNDSNFRILLAEDNSVMADVLRFNLERSGHTTVVASDGESALALAREQRFDLVITDYQMAGICGEQLCRLLRADPCYADIPLILCTAKGSELPGEVLRDELRLAALVVKPFSPRAVVRMVNELLAAPRGDHGPATSEAQLTAYES
jgi:CheY-like chemotaxis protein